LKPAQDLIKAMESSDTDDFWIKIESLQWVLFVNFAIRNGNMVVIYFKNIHVHSFALHI
jgi:hypothetical protein